MEPHFDWPGPNAPEGLTEAQAAALLGSRLLVGITHLDPEGEVAGKVQFHGVVEDVRPDGVALRRADSGVVEWLPPLPDAYERAVPGEYQLRSSGEVVTDPEYLCAWTIESTPAEP